MAKNLLTATATIQGVKPLLWHHFGPDALPLERQERTGVAGNDPEEWRRTMLVNANGQLYLDPASIFGSIRDGARHTRKGKGSLQPLVVATLQVLDAQVLVDRCMPDGEVTTDATQPVYLDIRGVRNPSTRGRNVRYRLAASPGWHATFSLLWDRTIVSLEQMQAALLDAGRLSGIGSGRAIGMGRYEIVSFEVSEAD
jgi:hypothetical protein